MPYYTVQSNGSRFWVRFYSSDKAWEYAKVKAFSSGWDVVIGEKLDVFTPWHAIQTIKGEGS